ncbi:MFS transporter [Georgenia alba]|uniref:MFS transporter n=1 Tax=Georgenia alba TaxID=2233858 RepID=A0ABW2Q2N2_9MICO
MPSAPPARRAPLVVLIVANVVSTVGGAMSLVALPWFVFEITGNTTMTGLAATCEFLAVAAASLVAGAFVRRLGPRATRVLSDVFAGVAVLAVPVLHATTGIDYPVLLVLVAVNGFLRTPAVAASFVLLARTADLARTTTDAVSGPYLASLHLANVIGAPLAGAVISLVGAPWALVVDAATFIASGLAVQVFLPSVRDENRDRGPSLRTATAYLRGDRLLVHLVAVSFVLSVALAGWGSVLAPVYGQRVLESPGLLAVILTANGIGSILGSSIAGLVGRRVRRSILMPGSAALAFVPAFVLLALRAPVPAVVAAMLVAGLGAGLFSATFVTIEYERIPTAEQAHVFGMVGGIGTAGVAIGPLLAGVALEVVTFPAVAAAIAVVGVLVAAHLTRLTGLREPGLDPSERAGLKSRTGARRPAP